MNEKTFIKSFEAPQRNLKIKIKLIFMLLQLSKMYGTGRVKRTTYNSVTKILKFNPSEDVD